MPAVCVGRPELYLNRNVHQGYFGEALMKTLAAAAGYTVVVDDVDIYGVDVLLRTGGGTKLPLAQIQVKTASDPDVTADHLRFNGLTEVQFNKIAGPDFRNPCFLVVITVPRMPPAPVCVTAEEMLVSCVPYWISLADRDVVQSPSRDRKVMVEIPRSNILTVEALTELADGVAAEGVR